MAKPISADILSLTPPTLIGGQCGQTGKIVFPLPTDSTKDRFHPVPLSTQGTLWSWTVQRFLPKSPPYAGPETPETFKPFAIGYVELPNQIIVEARIVEAPFEELHIGMPMTLTTIPFNRDVNGDEIVTYAFRPSA
jgi:uncharacterized protein